MKLALGRCFVAPSALSAERAQRYSSAKFVTRLRTLRDSRRAEKFFKRATIDDASDSKLRATSIGCHAVQRGARA
jgi:hypothetical protein